MQITIDLSERHVAFLQKMINDMKKYENISTIEGAVMECINMAMFDESETAAMQEGM